MEQTPSSPGRSPELPLVSQPPAGETAGAFTNPESINDGVAERGEQLNATAAAAQPAPPPVVLPAPTAPVADDANSTTSATSDLPDVAGDDELIEKEWVAKAKKVIAETKDDPYRREQEVGRLQEDYLMKRYGRKLGSIK